ncbi:mitochondrial import protein Pam17 [Suhomyces tanzawaensis NRRL Y-17324]|uniref:Presequence translocated-associated motor subunit PAM17 n=1 Tax=Suhomyces tanzawaensis NRRL Y-17324 TaxID=984487 RepID=A0A1E4SCA9_9ASCO|nr:mitochondrial import protein Pam17 [Suhomyces tanzawaensis NRRL Y-17324]ODV77032.1 mitochondrial import protein Pam17 [Suhomyces tanzawaensis NRRL Y-17324]
MFRQIGINVRASAWKQVRFNSTNSTPALNWVDFLKLKKENHVMNITASVFTTLAGGVVTLTYLGNYEFDPEKPILGMDPIMMMGGGVVLGGFVGYLFGPTIGTSLFRLKNRSILKQFLQKDSIFLTKIKANRVDPSSQSFSNPVPDYYGEKIYSLKGYKQWLRDCNAYRRKTKEFL